MFCVITCFICLNVPDSIYWYMFYANLLVFFYCMATGIASCDSMFSTQNQVDDWCYAYKMTIFQSMNLQGNIVWKRVKWIVTSFFMF